MDRGVRVVPEFDLPSHAASWLKGHPELAGPGQIGMLDPTQENTYAFLDAFIAELAELFPDEQYHFGCDEVGLQGFNTSSINQ
jgi:hexosaminidase